MKAERTFPILVPDSERRRNPDRPRPTVPWDFVAPHEAQAQANHGGQNLSTLAGRGGLSWSELLAVVRDRRWYQADEEECRSAVLANLARWREENPAQAMLTQQQLRSWRDRTINQAADGGATMELGFPTAWMKRPHYFCVHGHVSDRILTGDAGDRCLACHNPTVLGPPIDQYTFLSMIKAGLVVPGIFPGA